MTAVAISRGTRAERVAVAGRAAASAVMVAAFAYVFFIGGTHPGIAETSTRLTTQAIAIVVLGGWLVVAMLRPECRPTTPLVGTVALAFLGHSVAALVADRPRLAMDATLQAGAIALTFLMLSTVAAHPILGPRLRLVVAALPVVVVAAYVAHVLISWGLWYSVVGEPTAPPLRPPLAALGAVSGPLAILLSLLTTGLSPIVAGVIVLGIPFSVAVLWRESRALAIVVAGMAAFALLATASRSGLVGAMVGLAAAAALSVASGHVGAARRLASQRRAWLVGVPLVAAAGVTAPALIGRFSEGLDSARATLYAASVSMIASDPVAGVGPGGWAQLQPAFSPVGDRNIVQYHAHNTYLQTLADLGLVGAIPAAIVAATAVWLLWRSARGGDHQVRIEASAILVGLAGLAGLSLTDHLLNLPAYSVLLVGLVAMHARWRAPSESPPAGRRGLAITVAALVSIVVAVPFVFRASQAEQLSLAGRQAAGQGDWAAALGAFDEAARLDPGLTLYRLERALALAHVGDVPDALLEFESLVETDPAPHNYLSLAALRLAAGDPAGAMVAADEADRRTASEAVVSLNVANVAVQAGRPGRGAAALAEAFTRLPDIAASDYLRSPPLAAVRESALDTARNHLLTADPVAAAFLRGVAGDPEGGERELLALPRTPARDTALARLAWSAGRTDEAIRGLEAILDDEPMAQDALMWLLRYSFEVGDEARTARYVRWALLAVGGVSASTANVGDVIPAPADQRWRGVPEAYPQAVYLRFGLADPLAPGVLVIGVEPLEEGEPRP